MVYTVEVSAGVMELVDVVDSKSTDGDIVPVRVRPPAPKKGYPIGVSLFYVRCFNNRELEEYLHFYYDVLY